MCFVFILTSIVTLLHLFLTFPYYLSPMFHFLPTTLTNRRLQFCQLNFPPRDTNIPTAPWYGVYLTQLTLSNILTLGVPEEGYSRNVSRTLNLIFTYLFLSYATQELVDTNSDCYQFRRLPSTNVKTGRETNRNSKKNITN